MTKPCPPELEAFKHEPADYEADHVEAVTVEQCDRDAAAEFADCIFCHPDFLVQAFARHRTQANEAMRSLLAEARNLIDGLQSQFDFAGCTCTFPDNDCCSWARADSMIVRIDAALSGDSA